MTSIHLCYMNHRCIIYKDSERRAQRQAEIAFPTWLCRTASYLRSNKDTYKREQSQTKLALILFGRAKVSSSFNLKIAKGECRGQINLAVHSLIAIFVEYRMRFGIVKSEMRFPFASALAFRYLCLKQK